MKKVIIRLVIVLVVLAAAYGAYRVVKAMPQRQRQIATTKVRRGDVVVRSYARGELRAVRSATLTAPNLFGTVQVTRLAALGSLAREKDLIAEFDDSEVNSRIEEKQLELDQVDEQIKKAQAELAMRSNQDQVELLKTRYSVRRAELEVKRNELLSAIDAKRNQLTLEEAQRRLKQLESDIKSRQEQAQAELNVLRERKNKALLEMARERQRLSQVKLLAPMSGLVAIRQNFSGGFRMFGAQVPDIREGDQVSPGAAVADVLDLSELEVSAKVGELDRANLREGQDVIIRLDAIPEQAFNGEIKSMSGTASANFFSADPAKKFDVMFSIDMKQLLSALGAKPEQIARIMATAEQNRKKPMMASLPSAAPAMMLGGSGAGPGAGGPGGGGGAMMVAAAGPGMQAGGQGGVRAEAGAEGESGGRGQGGGRRMFGGQAGGQTSQLSEEQRTKLRAAMQKALNGRSMQDLSAEERQKVMQEAAKAAGVSLPAGGRQAGAAKPGAAGGEGMQFGFRGPGGPGPQMNEKDLASAKLPPAPEQDSQLETLIRPGQLADVEIIVEKIPNAINIPNQAVFEKGGKLIVYVRSSSGAWDERAIQPLKRSETTTVVADGLQPGETIALADPTETADSKKKKGEKKDAGGGGGSPMGNIGGRGGKQ
jgi:hypothetical protein